MEESVAALNTATDSLNFLELSNAGPLSRIYWCETYDAIRGTMGYSRVNDCFAARIAEALAYSKHVEGSLYRLESVCRLLSSRHVCITGGSASLEKLLEELDTCNVVVAVDGSTSLLLENGFRPSIVVTDLDGRWGALSRAAEEGSIMAIHVHGDNYREVVQFVTTIGQSASMLFSHQCPGIGMNSVFIPGFTDGERALGLALMCRPRSIVLYGMRTWENVGYWSKPWLRSNKAPWPLKARKLRIAEFFIRLFMLYGCLRGVSIIRR